MKSALFYKLLAGMLAVLLVVGAVYAGKTIHDTQLEVEHFRNDEEKAKSQLDTLKQKLDKNQAFLQRLETDPAFQEYVARKNLDYAKPDEYIYRFDVDPLTGAPAGNLDNAHPAANTTPAATSQPGLGQLHN